MAQVWAGVLLVGLVMAFIAGVNLSIVKTADPNRDVHVLHAFAEGAPIKVQVPGDDRVSYFVKISEPAFRALVDKTGWLSIGVKTPAQPIAIHEELNAPHQ